MRNFVKKIMVAMAAVILMGTVVPGLSVTSRAAECETGMTLARVAVPEQEVFATVARVSANGVVSGDGVRLRKKPSSKATILELMNYGEYVNIVLGESTANWYYLKRIKTGTYGYASKDYILLQ